MVINGKVPFLSCCALLSSISTAAAINANQFPIEAIPGVQKQIQNVIEIGTTDVPRAEKYAAMEGLRSLADDDSEKLIQQLLYFQLANGGESDVDMERLMLANYIIHYFSIPPTAIAEAVIPYIFTENRALHGEVERLLTSVEGVPRHKRPDFSHYQSLLQAGQKEHNPNLLRYMYERAPGEAVLTLEAVYREASGPDKHVLWTEHVVSDVLWKQQHGFLEKNEVEPEAVTQLERLSQHKAWWARLYVAEILRQHPEFRADSIVDALRNDNHELVREAIMRLRSGMRHASE